MAIPHKEWAIEKVRTLLAPCKEKSTLLAIAKYADQWGSKCYPAISTIAKDCGHSTRTVKRHIKKLVEEGQLMVERQGFQGRSNVYTIAVCRLTTEEREAILITPADGGKAFGVSRNQIKIPGTMLEDKSTTIVTEDASVEGAVEIHPDVSELIATTIEKLRVDIAKPKRRSTFEPIPEEEKIQ